MNDSPPIKATAAQVAEYVTQYVATVPVPEVHPSAAPLQPAASPLSVSETTPGSLSEPFVDGPIPVNPFFVATSIPDATASVPPTVATNLGVTAPDHSLFATTDGGSQSVVEGATTVESHNSPYVLNPLGGILRSIVAIGRARFRRRIASPYPSLSTQRKASPDPATHTLTGYSRHFLQCEEPLLFNICKYGP